MSRIPPPDPLTVDHPRRMRIPYDTENHYDLELLPDGGLKVRVTGRHGDLLSIHPTVANEVVIMPLRWDNARGCNVSLPATKETLDGK